MIKYYIILLVRFLARLLFVLPIKNNRILFYSFSGKNYTCSPKVVYEYLKKNYDDKFEMIWAVNVPERYPELKTVKYGSLQHVLVTVTSKFIITNTGPYKAVPPRKGQEIINTWHGGGAYKKTGMDNPYKDKYQYLYNKNLGQSGVSLFISSSSLFTKYAIRGAFGYDGLVLECGLPRNDDFFDCDIVSRNVEKVKEFYDIKSSAKIILYAPTWRNYSLENFEKLDVEQVLASLEQRFGGEWKFIYRGHNLSNSLNLNKDSRSIDATNYPEMQELLCAADFLISDYSSCIWDYSLLNRSAVLYTPDLGLYDEKFSFYTQINHWGFIIAKNNNELSDVIAKFDIENAVSMINQNHNYFGNKETGKATISVVEYIVQKC